MYLLHRVLQFIQYIYIYILSVTMNDKSPGEEDTKKNIFLRLKYIERKTNFVT